jgi:hypothetical protein
MSRDGDARFALGMRDEIVGQDKLGAGNRRERHVHFAGFGDQPDMIAGAAEQPAAKALPAGDWLRQLDLCFEPGKAVVILRTDQRPVDAGRADFQSIGAGDR